MNNPLRIRSGVANQTIANPARMPGVKVWHGSPDEFRCPSQKKNYLAIQALLAEKGLQLKDVFFCSYLGWNYKQDANLFRIAATVGDPAAPTFLWHKYECHTKGGGTNHVFYGGRRAKVTDFIRLGWKAFTAPCSDTKTIGW